MVNVWKKIIIPGNERNENNILLDLSNWQNQYIVMMECYDGLKNMFSEIIDIHIIDYHITLRFKKFWKCIYIANVF